ncbi:hypothetical protein [Escherichia coli]|uniref:hypothetical protein n=1 Tax=Escherichia coli TaxID=562 RepID=UPI00106F61C8|nr:hypothetical protein [Escherichia coli]
MSKKLTKSEKNMILDTIWGWSDSSITWEQLCEECSVFLKSRPSRQTLSYHKDIANAYLSKKKGIVDNANKFKKTSSLINASKIIFNLESRIKHLEEENRNLKEQFIKWQFNAYKYDIKEHQLEEELPKIDRRNDDKKRR